MATPSLTEDDLRSVREAYDALSRGDRAVLARCRSAAEIQLEGLFWMLVARVPASHRSKLAPVVVAFPGASQARRTAQFQLGRHLRRTLYASKPTLKPAEAVLFRRLLAAEDREELVHLLRRVLTRAEASVDWGVLGSDIVYWGPRVQRTWAQDFYSPLPKEKANA
jgi:CRISPR type I-E-associated protein CasB/Cse2